MTPTTVVRALVAVLALGAGAALAADVAIAPAGKSPKGYATGDMVLGQANAPVTVIEYASMTCPHCAMFHSEELPKLKQEYIDTGKVRLVFREFPLDGLALEAAKLARCAGPDRYFAMLDALFRQQMVWARPADKAAPLAELQRTARAVGIGEDAFRACSADKELGDEILARRLEGDQKHQIRSTPGFVINGVTLTQGRLMDAIADAVGNRPAAPAGGGAAAPAAAPDRTMYWAAGGVVAVAVVGGAGYFLFGRRNRSA
jgi:protein-disulfide isomerase